MSRLLTNLASSHTSLTTVYAVASNGPYAVSDDGPNDGTNDGTNAVANDGANHQPDPIANNVSHPVSDMDPNARVFKIRSTFHSHGNAQRMQPSTHPDQGEEGVGGHVRRRQKGRWATNERRGRVSSAVVVHLGL